MNRKLKSSRHIGLQIRLEKFVPLSIRSISSRRYTKKFARESRDFLFADNHEAVNRVRQTSDNGRKVCRANVRQTFLPGERERHRSFQAHRKLLKAQAVVTFSSSCSLPLCKNFLTPLEKFSNLIKTFSFPIDIAEKCKRTVVLASAAVNKNTNGIAY